MSRCGKLPGLTPVDWETIGVSREQRRKVRDGQLEGQASHELDGETLTEERHTVGQVAHDRCANKKAALLCPILKSNPAPQRSDNQRVDCLGGVGTNPVLLTFLIK